MKKRILLVSNHFYPYIGGLETYVFELGKGLVKKGIDVDILTYNYGEEKLKTKETIKGMTVYRLPSKSLLGKTYSVPKFNKTYKQIKEEILNKNYSTIITNTRFFTISTIATKYANILKKKFGTKFIHIEHGNKKVTHNNFLVQMISRLYDQIFGKYTISKADLVVCISRPGIHFVERFGARNTKLIHNSIHTEKFNKTKSNLRNKLEIDNNEFVIVYVGRLIYAKGVQNLIEALHKEKNTQLIIIGDGNYKKELIKLASKNEVKTIFTGSLNEQEIKDYLNIADLFINPSYSEGLPTSVLEAGAMGMAVIATDVGGTNEIISNKTSGILIEPNNTDALKNAIKTLKNLPKDARIRMGELLKQKIKKEFDWKETINKFEEIL